MTRLLIVDDDPSIRRLVSYALGDEGYQVDEASDGLVALEMVGRLHPDIIILDMRMPGMDGWEFAKVYRERYERQVPIIVLTAAPDAAQRAADVNAQDYVPKPFDLDALLERISAIESRFKAD